MCQWHILPSKGAANEREQAPRMRTSAYVVSILRASTNNNQAGLEKRTCFLVYGTMKSNSTLMPKVTMPCKYHCNTMFISSVNYFSIAN